MTHARKAILAAGASLILGLLTAPAASAATGQTCLPHASCISGNLTDGTPYKFAVPKNWNGIVTVDLDGAAEQFGGSLDQKLLAAGYARGGTTRAVTGWRIRQATDNQKEALAAFEKHFGKARFAIASGRSMGGFVSAAAAQEHSEVFDAAVSFCGGHGGVVGQWNQKLDTVFA